MNKIYQKWFARCKNAVKRNSGGFTLIELLVVVLIIGILASVAMPQYEKAVIKSRAATAMAQVKAVGAAREVYYLANGEYGPCDALDVDLPANTRHISYHCLGPDVANNQRKGQVYGWVRGPNDVRVGFLSERGNFDWNNRRLFCLATFDKNDITNQICQSLGGTPVENSAAYGSAYYYLE